MIPAAGPAVTPEAQAVEARIRSIIAELTTKDVSFDAHILMYFAQVGLTRQMRQVFGGRLHLADAVAWEVDAAVTRYNIADIQPVLDPPPWYQRHVITDPTELSDALVMQRDWELRYGLPYDKWKNKGEAEALVLCRRTTWPFVSNDGSAIADGPRFNVRVWSPGWVLLAFVALGLMTGVQAWGYYAGMRALNMGPWLKFPFDAAGKTRFMNIATVLE